MNEAQRAFHVVSFNKIVVTRFGIFLENRNLAAGTINGRLAAVRRLAYEAADASLLSAELAAGIRRQEAGSEAWKLAHGRGSSPLQSHSQHQWNLHHQREADCRANSKVVGAD